MEGANREAEILGTDRLMNGDTLFCCESCYAAFPFVDAFVTNAGGVVTCAARLGVNHDRVSDAGDVRVVSCKLNS